MSEREKTHELVGNSLTGLTHNDRTTHNAQNKQWNPLHCTRKKAFRSRADLNYFGSGLENTKKKPEKF